MSGPRIGALRQRVTLQRPVRTDAGGGAATLTWVNAASMFARVEPLSGREREIADRVASRVTHKVLIRYRDDVSPKMRFAAKTRVLEIDAVLDLEGDGRWLQCLCEERLP